MAMLWPTVGRPIAGLPTEILAKLREIVKNTENVGEKFADEAGLMGSAAPFFVMNEDARLEVRAELLPRLVADKERAAFSRDWFLGAMPTPDGPQSHIYVYVGRRGESPRRVIAQPTAADPELQRLWLALRPS